jgi:chromate transporter
MSVVCIIQFQVYSTGWPLTASLKAVNGANGNAAPRRNPFWEIFWVALRLGLTSFGGPIAHFGYFHSEYVERRRWVDEGTFADLLALSQAFPGAASSQLGFAIGMVRGGLWGGVAAWIAFTLPSAIILTAVGLGVAQIGSRVEGLVHGLVVVAVPVVALAVWKLWSRLAPDPLRSSMALGAAIALIVSPAPARFTVIVIILVGAFMGWKFCRGRGEYRDRRTLPTFNRRLGVIAAIVFFGLLAVLPIARRVTEPEWVDVTDAFYGAGALVFGGGPVVLPLLESEVVGQDWVNEDLFIAGFGAAQAIPGPVFTFSGYLGAVMTPEPNGIAGAVLAMTALYLPSLLMVLATLPFFSDLRKNAGVQAALRGVNAAVIGILLMALYDPLWTNAIQAPSDLALALAAFGLLAFWRLPPWLVVLLTATGGVVLAPV